MSNKITPQQDKKRTLEYALIFIIVTLALLTRSILSTNDIFEAAQNDLEKTGCNSKTDSDCIPDEIVVFDNPINTRLLMLDSQTTSSNTPQIVQ